jgi:hypothetical protein
MRQNSSATVGLDGMLRCVRGLAIAAGLAVALGGCGSMNSGVSQALGNAPGIGLPAGAPERPADPLAFPPVHDMPPPRTTAVLTSDEQRRIEKELVAAREGQRAAPAEEAPQAPALAPVAPSRKPVIQPRPAAKPRPAPASSAATIY